MSRPSIRLATVAGHVLSVSACAERVLEANPEYAGPLAGVRILDLTQLVSGPMGAQILGDQGADVIKIEAIGGAAERGGAKAMMTSPLCSVINRNKRSVAIDLGKPRGNAIFKKLVETADVVMQNFRPGVVDKMGIGYEEMKKVNPGIIYVSISGFGQTGPYSQKRVYDPVVQAVSGLASIQADETGRPRMFRLIVPDKLTAVTSAQAISTALVQKLKTGRGTHIDLSMLDSVVSFEWGEGFVQETFVIPDNEPKYEYTRDLVYETQDGYITCGAVQEKEWVGLCEALDKPEWISDDRFKTGAARIVNKAVRFDVTAKEIQKYTSAEVMARLNAKEVPNGPVNHPRGKVLSDPQVIDSELVFRTQHPYAPFQSRQARPAARFSSSPFELTRHAPLLGEHSREVLTSLGISESEIDELMKDKIVFKAEAKKPEVSRMDPRKFDPVSG